MALRLPLGNEVTELWLSQKGLHGTLELSWKPTTLKKRHLLKKNYFIGTHLNIRYTWCWLARTVCTFDIDGAKTKTVTGHDGEKVAENKT